MTCQYHWFLLADGHETFCELLTSVMWTHDANLCDWYACCDSLWTCVSHVIDFYEMYRLLWGWFPLIKLGANKYCGRVISVWNFIIICIWILCVVTCYMNIVHLWVTVLKALRCDTFNFILRILCWEAADCPVSHEIRHILWNPKIHFCKKYDQQVHVRICKFIVL